MNFLADESVDRQIVDRLRQESREVLYVAEMEPGIADEVVLARSKDASAVLITADKDFGELVFRKGQTTSGVLLVRLAGLTPTLKASLVAAAVTDHASELRGAFAVLTPASLRIRREPSQND